MRSAWVGVSLVCLALAAAPARAGEGPHLLAEINLHPFALHFAGAARPEAGPRLVGARGPGRRRQ